MIVLLQAVVVLQFIANGKQTVQRLEADPIILVPQSSLTLRYLLVPEVPSKKLGLDDDNATFSAMVDFINTG